MSKRLNSTRWPSTSPRYTALSVRTPSTSSASIRTFRAASAGDMRRLASTVPQVECALQQPGEAVQRPLRRGVGKGARWIRMGFEKEAVGAGHGGRRDQIRDVLAETTARAA